MRSRVAIIVNTPWQNWRVARPDRLADWFQAFRSAIWCNTRRYLFRECEVCLASVVLHMAKTCTECYQQSEHAVFVYFLRMAHIAVDVNAVGGHSTFWRMVVVEVERSVAKSARPEFGAHTVVVSDQQIRAYPHCVNDVKAAIMVQRRIGSRVDTCKAALERSFARDAQVKSALVEAQTHVEDASQEVTQFKAEMANLEMEFADNVKTV